MISVRRPCSCVPTGAPAPMRRPGVGRGAKLLTPPLHRLHRKPVRRAPERSSTLSLVTIRRFARLGRRLEVLREALVVLGMRSLQRLELRAATSPERLQSGAIRCDLGAHHRCVNLIWPLIMRTLGQPSPHTLDKAGGNGVRAAFQVGLARIVAVGAAEWCVARCE
jgi:hypothetical protein